MTRESTFWSRLTLDAGTRRIQKACPHSATRTVERDGEGRVVCLSCGMVTHREQPPVTLADRIDIREPMREFCARLGLDYEATAEIVFRPAHVTATVYKRNADGKFIYLEDEERVASETFDFEVRA